MPGTLNESYLSLPETSDDDGDIVKTIVDSLYLFSTSKPNQKAFVFVETNGESESVTWKELYEKSVKAARGFIHLGVKEHDIVAVNVRTCPDWLYINFGIILARAIAANISFTYTDGSDVIAMMEKLGACTAMVLDAGDKDSNWNVFKKLIDKHSADGSVRSSVMPSLKHLLLLDRPSDTLNIKTFSDMIRDAPSTTDLPNLHENDVIMLLQTSGSTGLPKAVAHTHASTIAIGSSMMRICLGNDVHDPGAAADVYYNDRPFTWMGGWPFNVVAGHTRVTRSGFGGEPEDVIGFVFNAIKSQRCHAMLTLPPMLHAMIERQDELGNDFLLEYIGTGGQPVTKDVTKCVGKICKQLGCGYGGTEFGAVAATFVSAGDEFEEYSSGHLLPGVEVKIVGKKGAIVPTGTRGEIYLKSKALFKEYWNDPEKTKAATSEDGWFKTDDIGHISKDGILFVEGRISDMILSGGMNVTPTILETAIKTCPDVQNVVIVPIPHPVWYQVVCACVIPVPGSDVTEETLRRYCESIHNDKPGLFTVLPQHYVFMEKFPETRTGKTSRKELSVMVENQLNNK